MIAIHELSDAVAFEALSQLSSEIRERQLGDPDTVARSPAEARELISQFVAQYCGIGIAPESILPGSSLGGSEAREIIAALADDPDTQAITQELLESPPAAGQKSIETAVSAAIVLGSLITWLQTKVDIEVARVETGQVRFRFALKKNASSPQLIQSLADLVGRLLGKK